MASLFSLIVQTTIYATIVGLMILLLKGLLQDKLNAKWHYLLWIVLILKLLIPFGPESVVSLFNIVPDIPVKNIQNFIEPMENPLPYEQPVMKQQEKTMKILPYIWLLGAMLMLFWLLISYSILHYKLRKHATPVDQRLQNILGSCKRKMKIEKEVNLLLQETFSTPSLFGIIRPKILLSNTVSKLSDKELEYIFLHELAHYKRKDVLINYLLLGMQMVHWFNPFLWYCFKRIRQDMEAAADERVLSILEVREHKEYGKALLTVLEGISTLKFAPKVLGMVDDKKSIQRRIRMIKMANLSQKKKRIFLGMGLLCLAVLSSVVLTSKLTEDKINQMQISAYPEKYTLTMSSTPGIRISVEYNGSVGKVIYATRSGGLLTWNPTNGQVAKSSSSLEQPYGTPVYWSPISPDGKASTEKNHKILITLYDQLGKKIDKKEVLIQYDGSRYYSVQTLPGGTVVDKEVY